MSQKKEGGKLSRMWGKHGSGYYGAVVVGTFVYLEIAELVSSIAEASGVKNFLTSELLSFGIETLLNSLRSSIWPLHWYSNYGILAIAVGAAGYFLWTFALAAVLNRREKEFRKELGL